MSTPDKDDWFSLFNSWKPGIVGRSIGLAIRTDFMEYHTPDGLHGLARCDGSHLEILAVGADRPGQGSFRRFIHKAKLVTERISIWEIWNEDLQSALLRYGFTPVATKCPFSGEKQVGLTWTKEPQSAALLSQRAKEKTL
jgi:hypothetical protein